MLWIGTATTVVNIYQRVCEPNDDPTIITLWSPFPPGFFIVVLPSTGFTYSNVLVSSTSFTRTTLVIQYTTETQPCTPEEPLNQVASTTSLSATTNDVITNLEPGTAAMRFDGRTIPFGARVDLRAVGAGSYVIEMDKITPTGIVTHDFNLTVAEGFNLDQIEDSSTDLAIPTAVFEFTNNTPDPVDAVFEAIPVQPGVLCYLSGNMVRVDPGVTVQRVVEFTTLPGYAIPEGAPLNAELNVHAVATFLPIIASLDLHSASKEATKGSGEDLSLATTIGDIDLPNLVVKTGHPNETLNITLTSPNNTFIGLPCGIYADEFVIGTPLVARFPAFPEYHLSAASYTLSSNALPIFGLSATVIIPPQLSGQVLRVQGIALSSLATNGAFATTDAHDIAIP